MKRRTFIALLGGAAAWPLGARAQQAAMPVVGFLYSGVPELSTGVVAAVRNGLAEAGFVEGRNVSMEFRFAYNDNSKLAELAADLVRRQVAVIITPGSTPSALAAKAATTSIPIVFSVGTDPVEVGLVANFNRPGGNVTGITSLNSELAAKRLGLLHDLVPNAARFAVLVNPSNPNADSLAETRGRRVWRPDSRSKFSRPGPLAISMKRLPAWCERGPTDFWSVPIHCWTTVASRSSRSRRITGCRRSTLSVRTSKSAG